MPDPCAAKEDQVSNRRNSSPTLEVGVFLLEKDKFLLKVNDVTHSKKECKNYKISLKNEKEILRYQTNRRS